MWCRRASQSPSFGRTLNSLVPAIFFIGQVLADYALSPYLVGRRVNLKPVWLLFALLGFGYLFGFVGLLIAVPLTATIGVLMRFAIRQFRWPVLCRRRDGSRFFAWFACH
jgi:predicted PurR-regulated permease PerM